MHLPEKWIWLPTDKYPEYQNNRYDGMNGTNDGKFAVAEFEKTYKFDKKVKSLALRFSGDTVFQLYLNGECRIPIPLSSLQGLKIIRRRFATIQRAEAALC